MFEFFAKWTPQQWAQWCDELPEEGHGRYTKPEWIDWVKQMGNNLEIGEEMKRGRSASSDEPAKGEPSQGSDEAPTPAAHYQMGLHGRNAKEREGNSEALCDRRCTKMASIAVQ